MNTKDTGDEALRLDNIGRSIDSSKVADLTERVAALHQQEQNLQQTINDLQARYAQQVNQQAQESQVMLTQLVDETLTTLSQRRQTLQLEVEQLERRRDRLQEDMRSSFAGVSQDLAVRVQGFKDYLVGSLQDLTTAAEQLQLNVPEPPQIENSTPLKLQSPRSGNRSQNYRQTRENAPVKSPQPLPSLQKPSRSPQPNPTPDPSAEATLEKRGFDQDAKQIRQILDQYRHSPNYYGNPWQLRRTFEPIHAKRVSQWFFDHLGRGSLKSMGSRLQNILVASAIISVLRLMKGDRIRVLILSDSPERLGEWRRGLQDCLGISRSDFGARQGVALFEAPEAVCQRADRLIDQGNQPLVLIDNSEDKVHLSLLQYPLWLAFAPDPREIPRY